MAMDQQEHLKPFVAAMDNPKESQRAQRTRKIQIGGMPNFQKNGKSHAKKGKSVKEEDRDQIANKEISHRFTSQPPRHRSNLRSASIHPQIAGQSAAEAGIVF